MRFGRLFSSLLSLVAACTSIAHAQTKYWDINGSTAGAGGSAPSGTWDTGSTANWNASSAGTGAATTWSAGNTAVFSAGSNATGAYTVTVNSTISLAGLTVEEGTISHDGFGALNFGTTPDAPINIAAGSVWNKVGGSSKFSGTGGLVKTGAGT